MSDYLLPCHPYGYNHPKERSFEGNVVALMAHSFTSLSLVDHECFRKMTQDLDPRLLPVVSSKLSWSIIPSENQSMERYVIGRLTQTQAILIIYDLCMSRKTEENFSLTAYYCTVIDRNNTHIGMPSTTATYGVSLSKSVAEVVENFGLEAKIVGITSDGGGNIWFYSEALEPKYSNDSILQHPSPSSTWSAL